MTPRVVEEFLAVRREVTSAEGVARRGLGPLLRFLRGCGVIPRDAADDGTPVELLLADYRDYLLGERGLAAESVRCYIAGGRKFLADLAEPLDRSLQRLDAAAVTSFIVGQARRSACVWSAKTLVTATRSLLRFLHVEGLISAPLVGAVPAGGGLEAVGAAAWSGPRAGRGCAGRAGHLHPGGAARSRGADRAGAFGASWRGSCRAGP